MSAGRSVIEINHLTKRNPVKTLTGKNLWQWTLVVAGTMLVGLAATAAGEQKADAEAVDNTEYNNWITLGVGSPFVNGDSQAFRQRYQRNKRVFGGIEDFHWEQNVGKKGLFELNGHGIYDENNYGMDLKLSGPDTGYIKAGYAQFRTWNDNSGGFYPGGTNNWFELSRELAVDRGRAWFEAGLTMPDVPQITFRYEHEFREGHKASTIWGDSDVSSTPGVFPVPTATSRTLRGFAPTFLGLDERRDSFSLKLKHTLGNTDYVIGGSYQRLEYDNTRTIHRRPGELAGANTAQTADRYVTERERLEQDLFNAHAMTETRINDKVKLTLGGIFTTLDTDISGSRIYGNQEDPVLGNYLRRQARDSGYFDLGGGGNVKQYVANLNLLWMPTKTFVIVPSVRIEKEEVDGFASYRGTTTATTSPFAFSTNAFVTLNASGRDYLEVTEALEARYTGFKNWALYARAELSQASQDRSESIITTTTSSFGTDWERFGQKYTAGANWFVLPGLNMGGQYYYKVSDNEWTTGAAKDTRYLETHDLNYRLTWRPLSQLSFVTRYDFQISTVQHQSGALPEVESGRFTSHIISKSINWTPTGRLYVQLNGSYAWDGAINTPVAGNYGITNFAPNLENGYVTANATLGYALDEISDLTLQYNYYFADNYVNNSSWSQPYGASGEEQSITTTISRQLNKRTKVSLKHGYFHSRDDTSGGNNNFDAHLIYATLQYRF